VWNVRPKYTVSLWKARQPPDPQCSSQITPIGEGSRASAYPDMDNHVFPFPLGSMKRHRRPGTAGSPMLAASPPASRIGHTAGPNSRVAVSPKLVRVLSSSP